MFNLPLPAGTESVLVSEIPKLFAAAVGHTHDVFVFDKATPLKAVKAVPVSDRRPAHLSASNWRWIKKLYGCVPPDNRDKLSVDGWRQIEEQQKKQLKERLKELNAPPIRPDNVSDADWSWMKKIGENVSPVRRNELSAADWSLLNKIWENLPPIGNGVNASEWPKYWDAFNQSEKKPEWFPVPCFKMTKELAGFTKALPDDIKNGALVARLPPAFAPNTTATDDEQKELVVFIDDLKPYAKRCEICIQVAVPVEQGAPAAKGATQPVTSPSGDDEPDNDEEDWIIKACAIAQEIGMKRWEAGMRKVSARDVHEGVTVELALDKTTWGKQGQRDSHNVRNVGLRGWKFTPPKKMKKVD